MAENSADIPSKETGTSKSNAGITEQHSDATNLETPIANSRPKKKQSSKKTLLLGIRHPYHRDTHRRLYRHAIWDHRRRSI